MGPRSADTTDKAVGMRIRMERLAAGLSQQDLAAAIGISFQQVQKYEKGVNRISASRIRQICATLHVPVESLVGAPEAIGSPLNEELGHIQQFLATKHGSALMSAFCAIKSEIVKRELVSLVKEVANSEVGRPRTKPAQGTKRKI